MIRLGSVTQLCLDNVDGIIRCRDMDVYPLYDPKSDRSSHAKKDLRPEGIHRRIVALDPICYLLEWVHGCRGRPCTRWLPLLVLLLINWPVRWASSICGDVKSLNSTDTEFVQASLREQIFAHRPVFATMNTHLPIDLRISFADIDLGDQRAPGSLREHLQVSEVAILDILAIF